MTVKIAGALILVEFLSADRRKKTHHYKFSTFLLVSHSVQNPENEKKNGSSKRIKKKKRNFNLKKRITHILVCI